MGLKGLPGMCEAQSDHALGEHGDVFLTAATKKLQRVILEPAGLVGMVERRTIAKLLRRRKANCSESSNPRAIDYKLIAEAARILQVFRLILIFFVSSMPRQVFEILLDLMLNIFNVMMKIMVEKVMD